MNFVKIEGKIVNLDLLTSALVDETTQTLILHTTHGQLVFPLNDVTQAAYDWLAAQCIESFDAAATPQTTMHGVSPSAWGLMQRIGYHEQRTDMPGLPIDDDDTQVTIELERAGYIRTDVHNAWLTEAGRSLLETHRAENANADEG